MAFVDVTNDVAFRKIFGNEQKTVILISFLNAVLGLEGPDRIAEVTLLNPYQLPRIIGEKASIIDVKAKDEKGETFIIEMQIADPNGFEKRVLYYTCKDYAGQIIIGEDYPELCPVYFIGVLGFNFFEGENYLSTHIIQDRDTGECKFSDLQFRFIELPKFNKRAEELVSVIDKWAYFLKNAKTLEMIPTEVDDEGLKEAYTEAARHNWTKEEYDAYIYQGMREQDARGIVTKAVEKAVKIAVKEAVETALDEVTRKYISSMHQNGIPTATIATVVNLSEEEVAKVIAAS